MSRSRTGRPRGDLNNPTLSDPIRLPLRVVGYDLTFGEDLRRCRSNASESHGRVANVAKHVSASKSEYRRWETDRSLPTTLQIRRMPWHGQILPRWGALLSEANRRGFALPDAVREAPDEVAEAAEVAAVQEAGLAQLHAERAKAWVDALPGLQRKNAVAVAAHADAPPKTGPYYLVSGATWGDGDGGALIELMALGGEDGSRGDSLTDGAEFRLEFVSRVSSAGIRIAEVALIVESAIRRREKAAVTLARLDLLDLDDGGVDRDGLWLTRQVYRIRHANKRASLFTYYLICLGSADPWGNVNELSPALDLSGHPEVVEALEADLCKPPKPLPEPPESVVVESVPKAVSAEPEPPPAPFKTPTVAERLAYHQRQLEGAPGSPARRLAHRFGRGRPAAGAADRGGAGLRRTGAGGAGVRGRRGDPVSAPRRPRLPPGGTRCLSWTP